MKKNKRSFSKKAVFLFRIIAAAGILISAILTFIQIRELLLSGFNVVKAANLTANLIITAMLILFQFFPAKVEIFSVVTFYYACRLLIFEPENILGIFMYWLTILTLYIKGYFDSKKKLKDFFSILICLVLLLTEIRFGFSIFFQSFAQKTGCTLILFISMSFFQIYITDDYKNDASDKKLDLASFSELKKRDAEWLLKIINGVKYQAIAAESNVTLGTVKNRMKTVFCTLGVEDKQGFMKRFSDYDIFFAEERMKNHVKTEFVL